MRTSNSQIFDELKSINNFITRNSLENILSRRALSGDQDALAFLTHHLKNWPKPTV